MPRPPLRLHPRSRLLVRPEGEPPSFHLDVRERAILLALARHRLLTLPLLARIDGGSAQNLARRLRLLWLNGFVDIVLDELNSSYVYALATRGARELADSEHPVATRIDWHGKNRRLVSRDFIRHTLDTAGFVIDLDAACRAHGRVKLLDHHELRPYLPAATQAKADPFKLRVNVRPDRGAAPIEIAIVPDRVLSTVYPDETRHNLVLEIDEGTMDVKARRLVGKSSIVKKIIGYYEAWRADHHRTTWGFAGFRVLFVTPSVRRIETMRAAQREITRGRAGGLFAYSTPELITTHGVLGPAWLDADGKPLSLLPPSLRPGAQLPIPLAAAPGAADAPSP